ncbi:MAG: hypothetical protein RL385_1405 [Pseudomonadota bacterium]
MGLGRFRGQCLHARPGRPARLWTVLFLAATCAGLPPRAQGEAPSGTYESARTEALLLREKLNLEPSPEGKTIAFIRIVRDEVFVREEAIPHWLNVFHAVSREQVVRYELLFGQGEPYRTERVEETMRNLRGMGIFALARIVAVQTGTPGQVGVVVHTRDLWSLRLETAFEGSTYVDNLTLRATERNLFGFNKAVGVELSLTPKTEIFAANFAARRVQGSRFALNERAGLIVNRARQEVEGKLASFSFGQPFYALRQRLAFAVDGAYTTQIARQLLGSEVRTYRPRGAPDDSPTALRAYRRKDRAALAYATYRLGSRVKHSWLVGWDYREVRAHAVAESMLPDGLQADFARDVLPRARRDLGPVTSYDLFTPSYVTFNNLATYGQSENVRIGPRLVLGTRYPRRSFGALTSSTMFFGTLGYTAAPWGAYVDAQVVAQARRERATWIDQRADFRLRMASPVFSIFRLVTRLELDLRRRDSTNAAVSLGTDNGLRGHVARSLIATGGKKALANVELRTLPIAYQAVHIGGVLFFDVGTVFNHRDEIVVHHAVGIGLRLLFPQLNRYPFSFDGGAALDRSDGINAVPFQPSFASDQSIPITAAEDPL